MVDFFMTKELVDIYGTFLTYTSSNWYAGVYGIDNKTKKFSMNILKLIHSQNPSFRKHG